MSEPIQFHTDLYRRDALERAAEKYRHQARIELAESGSVIVARVEPLGPTAETNGQVVRYEFCTEALSATVRSLRDLAAGDSRKREHADPVGNEPPWGLLAPFGEGAALGRGWVLESLSPIRGGATTMLLRHERDGIARVNIRRNGGAPLGVAHTDHLDFMLMNGGGGSARTEESIGQVLTDLAATLRAAGNGACDAALLSALRPHTETHAPSGSTGGNGAARPPAASGRVTPHIDPQGCAVSVDFDASGVSRLALYDALLRFADRSYVFLTRPDAQRIGVQLMARGRASKETLAVLARDVARALNQVARNSTAASTVSDCHTGLPPLSRPRGNIDKLLDELDAADPTTLGLGFQPERGPGHVDLRVLNIRGTGACDSDCVFCIEKFNPTHRSMPNADATRQLILDSSGQFDMLFFASGEPTIHPKLFEYVELAKSVGFTCFGMSSHFRTFADPRFALKTLQAGFEYFDIALHAADTTAQLEVNPIGDDGRSLHEALKGLGNILRLAEALGIRVSITHKIVISRLNVTRLEPIFRSTYDRGVRHYILQPVRTLGLAPALQSKLAISEEGILPHLNELLRKTEGLGAVLKPYGFSRQNLVAGDHVESEQNRVKNIYGRARGRLDRQGLAATDEERPTDGRHWVQVKVLAEDRFGFASAGNAPVLDEALERGVDLPFGCRMGSCGMCCARLLEGRVDQSNQIFLTNEQIEQGYVLMCQARPLSDVVLQVCTDDEIDQL
jgi:ferredoxin